MALKIDPKEVWHWYEVFEEFHSQYIPVMEFCKANRLNPKAFRNRYTTIIYKSRNNPALYAKLVAITREYIDNPMPLDLFIKSHDISKKWLTMTATHLRYLDMIEELKAEKGQKPMQFIQVPSIQNATVRPSVEGELMKQQNHVELIISAGVKVVVAPEVGADKLIRIIELLKDL